MLISHKKKFIFIHIYKTAGSSVMNVFLPYARLIDRMVFDFRYTRKFFSLIIHVMNWYDDGQKQFTGVHKHAPAFSIKNYMGEKRYRDYFSFVFVRNPFDLLVSLYFYISQTKVHKDYQKVINMNFTRFASWYLSTNPPRQVDFVIDPVSNELIVDYIGRFETLNEDMAYIKGKLGIATDRGLQHRNPSKNRKSKNYKEYFDSATIELVSIYFKDDLEFLGYRYDGSFTDQIPITIKEQNVHC